jgi:hypothetical protein
MKLNAVSTHARQFRRHETRYEARLEAHRDHAEQFRLAFPDAQSGLAVVDVSKGGVGLDTGIFLPRNLRVTLHIRGVALGPESKPLDLTIRAVVRRCTLVDHKPTYLIGLQFLDPTGRDERLLMEQAAASAGPVGEPVTLGEAGER